MTPTGVSSVGTNHRVMLDEALEALDEAPTYQPARAEGAASLNPTGEPRYLAAGKTESGRRLWVIFADEGGGVGRILTAREARGASERSRHRRMRGE